MKRVAFAAALTLMPLSSAPAQITPCVVERIAPASAQDMAVQFNDTLACLVRRIELLERELGVLRGRSSVGSSVSDGGQMVEGISIALQGMSLAKDKATIVATFSVTNPGREAVLAMIVGLESSFVIPGTPHKSHVDTNGILNCPGGAATTKRCLENEATHWTRLQPRGSYVLTVTSRTNPAQMSAVRSASVMLRFLTRIGDDSKPHDLSFSADRLD